MVSSYYVVIKDSQLYKSLSFLPKQRLRLLFLVNLSSTVARSADATADWYLLHMIISNYWLSHTFHLYFWGKVGPWDLGG